MSFRNLKYLRYMVVLVPLIAGCPREAREDVEVEGLARQQAEAARAQVQQGLKGARLQGGELSGGDSQGRPLWRISAQEIVTSGGELLEGTPKQAKLTRAEAILYRAGQEDSRFSAQVIELSNSDTGLRFRLSGGVKARSVGAWVKNKSPITLVSERADVDVKNRTFSISGKVELQRDGLKLGAGNLRGQTSLKLMTLGGGLNLNSPDGKISAPTGVWDWENNRIKLENPSAVREDVTLSGELMTADTAGKRGELRGKVKVLSPQGQAQAQSARFDWGRDTIQVTNVTVQGSDGVFQAAVLNTDSHFKYASATTVTVKREGLLLKMTKAEGFNKLQRITGLNLVLETEGMRGTAATGTWGDGSFQGSGGVSVVGKGVQLKGQKIKADQNFHQVEVVGGARAVLKDGTVITAPRLQKNGELLLAASGAEAKTTSQGSLGRLVIKAGRLTSRTTSSLVELSGAVSIVSEHGTKISAPRATYNHKLGLVTASGGVNFYDHERDLEQTGDSLVVDLGKREAVLKNVKGSAGNKILGGKNLFE